MTHTHSTPSDAPPSILLIDHKQQQYVVYPLVSRSPIKHPRVVKHVRVMFERLGRLVLEIGQ